MKGMLNWVRKKHYVRQVENAHKL